jgi:peroxiredoxin
MTYDDGAILAEFHQSQNLGYPLLHDEGARHVGAFDILNEDYEPGDRAYGIPYPGVIYISAGGVVELKFAVPGYRSRPPMETVHEAVSRQIRGSG